MKFKYPLLWCHQVRSFSIISSFCKYKTHLSISYFEFYSRTIFLHSLSMYFYAFCVVFLSWTLLRMVSQTASKCKHVYHSNKNKIPGKNSAGIYNRICNFGVISIIPPYLHRRDLQRENLHYVKIYLWSYYCTGLVRRSDDVWQRPAFDLNYDNEPVSNRYAVINQSNDNVIMKETTV